MILTEISSSDKKFRSSVSVYTKPVLNSDPHNHIYFKEKTVTFNKTTVNKVQYTAKYIIPLSAFLLLYFLV
jgi:hypothetical protein